MVKFKPKRTKGYISKKFEEENPTPNTLAEAMVKVKKGRKIVSVIESEKHLDLVTKDGRTQKIKK